jgi:predicted transcriptional regulator
MLGRNLIDIFEAMRDAGLVKSRVHFSKRWLGRGGTYYRDFQHRPERLDLKVANRTVATLRGRLLAVAALSSKRVADRIDRIIDDIDSSSRVSAFIWLGR